ncbi:MAG: methyltransferase domain-containing protein [Lentisphaerae bacterium]|nr:methyltransferase domain-containing protein [Lentisphaerota bacterium]
MGEATGLLPLDALFANPSRPLCVDVGCGKGRYLAAVARHNSNKNFLGIDRQLSRLRRVSRKLVREELHHVRLIQAEAAHAIHELLPDASVAIYTLFFPDPWPKRRHHRRRLFSPAFLGDIYRTLRPDGRIHVATDHLDYFRAISTLFGAETRFGPIEPLVLTPDEQTDFELLFVAQGKPIGRASYEKR